MKNVKENKKIDKEQILQSKKIQRFIRSKHSGETRKRYEFHIKDFFKFIKEDPESYFNEDYEFLPLDKKKILSKKYKRDIEDYKDHLMYDENKYGSNFKSASIRTILSVIKSCFVYNEIDLPSGFWKKTNDFKNSTTSIIETPTPEQLMRILNNTDIQGKCLFGIMKDSGSRISSVLKLKRSDIVIDREYPKIKFFYKNVKNGTTKIKRVTPETKHFLESLFEKYNFKEDDLIFPMTRQNANYKWECALKKTKLYKKDENTNRATMTTQCLKRFFKGNAFGTNKGLCDFFAEHGNLDQRYINISDEQLDKEYAKIVNPLLVYERPYDTDVRIKQLQKDKDELKGKLKVISDKLAPIEEKKEEYEQRFKKIEKNLNISLNPETKRTQNHIDFVESLAPLLYKLTKGKEGTPEQIEKIKKVFKEVTPEVLQNVNKLPTAEEKLNPDIVSNIIQKKLRQI